MLIDFKYVLYSYFLVPCDFTQGSNYTAESTDGYPRTIIQSVEPRTDINKFFAVFFTNKLYSKLIDIQFVLFQHWVKLNLILEVSVLKHFFNIAQMMNNVHIDIIQKYVVFSESSKLVSFAKSNPTLREENLYG